MNKILLIISREYSTRVKKKSFLITTILLPIVIMALYGGMIALTMKDIGKGNDEKENVLLIDSAGLFKGSVVNSGNQVQLTLDSTHSDREMVSLYSEMGFDGYLYISRPAADSPHRVIMHSQGPLSPGAADAIEYLINDSITSGRLASLGLSREKYSAIRSDVKINYLIDSGKDSKVSVPEIGYIVSYACGFLIYIMMLIYGTQVMRGVMEEKISRISEIIISSVKPFQLMIGKILGIGAVGLTQFLIWILLVFILQSSLAPLMPDAAQSINAADPSSMNEMPAAGKIMAGLASLPLLKIMLSFAFYFLFGYLTYAAIFASIGSAVSDDQQDAQQLLFPVMMPIIFGFIILTRTIEDPYSGIAVFGSYFPLTSPIVMMGRITYDIPLAELLSSMLLLVLCFLFITWVASRIYRVGILMYGKKPTWKELIKWGFRK